VWSTARERLKMGARDACGGATHILLGANRRGRASVAGVKEAYLTEHLSRLQPDQHLPRRGPSRASAIRAVINHRCRRRRGGSIFKVGCRVQTAEPQLRCPLGSQELSNPRSPSPGHAHQLPPPLSSIVSFFSGSAPLRL
jgi:hypothetical protein